MPRADLMVPQAPFGDLAAANAAAAAWCAEVNGAVHSEICAVPAERLVTERELLAPLPSLRASIGQAWSPARSTGCPACGSARPATRCPARLIGTAGRSSAPTTGGCWSIMTATGEVVAEHALVAPGRGVGP